VLALLHRLADRGVAVALTTHREADIEGCDRVVLVSDGRITGDDTPEVLLGCFGAARVSDLYRGVGDFERRPEARRANLPTAAPSPRPRARTGSGAGARDRRRPSITPWRQVALLTRRNSEVMVRNRLTLAVLLGSPLLVTAMMATLFGPGSFDGADPSGVGPVHLTFWLAFAGFFFGLTYGLLQVVVELPVLERDRFAGVSPAAYVASKVLVLAPLLVAVAAVLLVTLRELERLPALCWPTMAMLLVTLTLESLSALALGLLASALVRDPSQATLALPMLCFPQVLFSDAVVPVDDMTVPGRLMSAPLANRWGFEALGRDLGLGALGDLPAVGAHGAAFSGSVLGCWAVLALSAAALLLVTRSVLGRTTVAPPS
jgi:ABC transport system ATP-binding/permease protein